MERTLFVALFALGACDGSDTNVNRVYPDLVVTPASVDFGDVAVLYSSAAPVQVINAGLASLEIASVSIAGADAALFAVDNAGPLSLAKDESAVFSVTFAPDTYLPFAAELVIESNDEEHPDLRVPLTGTGVYAPTADIAVTPQALEFGTVEVGDTAYQVLEISNEGGATLTLGNAVQRGSGAFTLQGADPSGYSIAPGQSQQLIWAYTPTIAEGDNGTYVIESNDPDEPEITVTILGNGGGDFVYPEAVINCDETIEPRQVVVLDGSGSSDPEGKELSFNWTLDGTPVGSDVDEIIDDTLPIAHFTTDVAGEYTVGLVVTNTDGVSSAKRSCKMDAIPTEQLHVELSWSTNSADLDLHLVMVDEVATCEDGLDNDLDGFVDCDAISADDDGPCASSPECKGGVSQGLFSLPNDCNYCSGVNDWGVLLDGNDNPSLDIDDRSGYGPENTNIDVPVDGTYRVLIHYFDDHGDGDTVAIVRVYAMGTIIGERTLTMGLNTVWEVGQINWTGSGSTPAGTFGVTDVYHLNVVSDADGSPVLDEAGHTKSGPYDCFGE